MANQLFRDGKISFLQIADLVEKTVNEASFSTENYTLSDVLEADRWARERVKQYI